MLNDVMVLNTPIAVNIKLFLNVFFIVIDLNDALNFEHTDQHVLKEPNFDLQLDND
jgi:hypothetical protein